MSNALTLSPTVPLDPGMDYAFLRKEGIEQIAAIAGNTWSDHNAHDPGITILEILCYALTDLSYRLSFDMEDLLAYPADAPLETRQQFFTAREILTVNPLTVGDYRKLLIDIDGVKNAWLEPLDNPEPALYTDSLRSQLSFATPDLTQLVKLKGLYRVLLDKDPAHAIDDAQLVSAAKAKLYAHRNLCEDFAEIQVLGSEQITIRADVELDPGVNHNALMAKIYAELERFISPNIDILSLNDLIAQGRSPEELFDGPALEHGFIDDEQLQQFDRKTELHTSDLIRIMLDMPGVKAVKSIFVSSNQSPTLERWSLALSPNLTPRLKALPAMVEASDFTFYQGAIAHSFDIHDIQTRYTRLSATRPFYLPTHRAAARQPQDFPLPKGEYRELTNYESIQNEFPLNYGIGDVGLPASASPQRKAQAKQLQAYLTVFDQLLANACAQLASFKDLFSFNNPVAKSYFAQSVARHPGTANLLTEDYAETLYTLLEDEATALERKDRMLNHLLAHFSEKFTDSALLFPDAQATRSRDVIQKKVDFLGDYLRVSRDRAQAYNVLRDPNSLDYTDNLSGLKRRIGRLLGLSAAQEFLGKDKEGFHIVEHILLRPTSSNPPDAEPGFLGFAQPITAFSQSETAAQVTCLSPEHRLNANDLINIFYSSYYTGTYRVIPRELANGDFDPDAFDIEADYVQEDEGIVADTGQWVNVRQSPDPFSYQISIVLPKGHGRLGEEKFKRLLYDTLMAETPAHITIYLRWCDREEFEEFETTYMLWRQTLAGTAGEVTTHREVSYRLLNFLRLGSSSIPDFPDILGYMSVGDDFVVY